MLGVKPTNIKWIWWMWLGT